VVVGQNALRKEGYDKPTGAARYVDGIMFKDILFDKTVYIWIQRAGSRYSP